MGSEAIRINLSAVEAKVLWDTLDGALDAGACEGGNTEIEADAMQSVMEKLLRHFPKFKEARLHDPNG